MTTGKSGRWYTLRKLDSKTYRNNGQSETKTRRLRKFSYSRYSAVLRRYSKLTQEKLSTLLTKISIIKDLCVLWFLAYLPIDTVT